MRRTLAIVSLLAFIAVSMAAAEDELQPQIEIPKIRHDVGKVFEQDKYEYGFVVRNRGKADLVIEKVDPG